MRTLKLFATLVIAALSITTINAQEKSEIRNVTGFNGISVSESIKVELTQGKAESVEVIADVEDIGHVVTELNGTTLKIHMEGNNWNGWNKKVLVKVTALKIEYIEAGSSSSLITQNLLESDKMDISVNSSAYIEVTFTAPNSSCEASSSATAKLKGVTKFFEAEASSSANIHANELKAVKVKAEVSSSADIEVYVEEELDAEASSSGSIKYIGNPKIKDIEKSSSGSVSKD